VKAVVYSGYGIMPELAEVADPICPPGGVVTVDAGDADGTLRPGLLIGDVIGLEGTGSALAAMDGLSATAAMTVVTF
jgi:hypothetical protein